MLVFHTNKDNTILETVGYYGVDPEASLEEFFRLKKDKNDCIEQPLLCQACVNCYQLFQSIHSNYFIHFSLPIFCFISLNGAHRVKILSAWVCNFTCIRTDMHFLSIKFILDRTACANIHWLAFSNIQIYLNFFFFHFANL